MSKATKRQASLPRPSESQAESQTSSWFTERLKHAEQIRFYKRIAFWVTGSFIMLMYLTFFALLGLTIFCPECRAVLEEHKHFLGIMLALLIVPSALAWGVVRSVFRAEAETSTESAAKAIATMYPYAQ